MLTMNSHSGAHRMLEDLHVGRDLLSPRQTDCLDNEGYLIIPDFITGTMLETLRNAYEAVIRDEGIDAGKDHHQEAGARRIGNLVNKGEIWYWLWTHPIALAAAWHVLGRDFRLGAMSGRDPLPGGGYQSYHLDCSARDNNDQPYAGFAVCIFLDEFTPSNGSTRLVPGSHRRLGMPPKEQNEHLPGEITLVAKAGSAFFFNAHLWHAGNINVDGSTRRLVHVYYQGRENTPWLDQRKHFRPDACRHLSTAARRLLDVELAGEA